MDTKEFKLFTESSSDSKLNMENEDELKKRKVEEEKKKKASGR